MTDLTETDVKAILKLFEDSNFDYLEFEDGDLKLAVAKMDTYQRGCHMIRLIKSIFGVQES